MSKPPFPEAAVAMPRKPNPAVITTLRRDGQPVSTATWYLWDDGQVLVNMDEGRKRLEHMRNDPLVALDVLDPVHAVVFLDAIVVKVRDNHVVQNKPAYLAVGIDADGDKHVLGIWVAKTVPGDGAAGEGAGFWRSVMADLKNRGVRDILIACCDGLSGSWRGARASWWSRPGGWRAWARGG
jgi:Transposase, Mutator family/Pyridoxamine 5'-phosphate oxidase